MSNCLSSKIIDFMTFMPIIWTYQNAYIKYVKHTVKKMFYI